MTSHVLRPIPHCFACQTWFERSGLLHVPRIRTQLFFPDRRLIQFDCGKLQVGAGVLLPLGRALGAAAAGHSRRHGCLPPQLLMAFPDPIPAAHSDVHTSIRLCLPPSLQELAVLLARLKAGGHKCLIFTQMSKMLDVLEVSRVPV